MARQQLRELPEGAIPAVLDWVVKLGSDPRPAGTEEHEGLYSNRLAPDLRGCTVYWEIVEHEKKITVVWFRAPLSHPSSAAEDSPESRRGCLQMWS